MQRTCLPVVVVEVGLDLEKPGGSRMCAVELGGLGKGACRAVTHGGSGRGGKAMAVLIPIAWIVVVDWAEYVCLSKWREAFLFRKNWKPSSLPLQWIRSP